MKKQKVNKTLQEFQSAQNHFMGSTPKNQEQFEDQYLSRQNHRLLYLIYEELKKMNEK